MIYDDSHTTRKHMAIQREPIYVHRRKRCACNRVITERQQKQYSMCNQCVKEVHIRRVAEIEYALMMMRMRGNV